MLFISLGNLERSQSTGSWQIIPIFKKGKKEHPSNYRPVSLTLVPGKIMEQIIPGVIEKHLKDNGVISHSQHGCMKGKSCLTNLISFFDKVSGQREDSGCGGVFILAKCLILSLTVNFWTKCPAYS